MEECTEKETKALFELLFDSATGISLHKIRCFIKEDSNPVRSWRDTLNKWIQSEREDRHLNNLRIKEH